MHVVYLVPFAPHALVPKAGGQFLHAYLAAVADWADVTVIVPGGDDASSKALPANVRLIEVTPPTRGGYGPRVKDRLACRALGLSPAPPLQRIIRAHMATSEVADAIASATLVEIHFSRYLDLAQLVRAVAPRTPIIAFEHDVFAQVLARRLAASKAAARVLVRLRLKRHARREAIALNAVDAVLVLSEKDKQLVSDLGVQTPIHIVDPWVPLPPVICDAAGLDVLFVAEFSRPVNSEAAHWFLDQVWPLIEREGRGSRLVLAGSNPPKSLRRRRGPSVEVTGYVADLGPYYRQARVAVAPLRSGGGVRFKVLEAMAHGIPTVATSVASEGIAINRDEVEFGAVADTSEAMAGAVLHYLRDREAAARVGIQARAWVETHLSLDRTVSAGRRVYELLASRASNSAPPTAGGEGGREPNGARRG